MKYFLYIVASSALIMPMSMRSISQDDRPFEQINRDYAIDHGNSQRPYQAINDCLAHCMKVFTCAYILVGPCVIVAAQRLQKNE